MHINDLPHELLCQILEDAARQNERDGVTFTFGFSQAPMPSRQPLQKYIRGPLTPDNLRWDTTAAIRCVCRTWHDWALGYALRDMYIKKSPGCHRWAELSQARDKYHLYELMAKPTGTAIYRDPWGPLRKTVGLLSEYPQIAEKVRKMWFNGFSAYETTLRISAALSSCPRLTHVSLPWITVRHLGAHEWRRMLGLCNGIPISSLEFLAVDQPEALMAQSENAVDKRPLESGLVNFSQIRRLKIFGDTTFMPLIDEDLEAIARTASNLEEFQLSGNSTVSIQGVMAIVKASHSSLRVLDHSPRANRGFAHPHPGRANADEHICEILSSCPRLNDISVSLPSMCATMFSNHDVVWRGDVQVRAAHLCGHEDINGNTAGAQTALQKLLDQSRRLVDLGAASIVPRSMYVELFFADYIFEPSEHRVHGDFESAEVTSNGTWPAEKYSSGKGPYGASGFYGKEITMFESVDEREFMHGVRRNLVSLVG